MEWVFGILALAGVALFIRTNERIATFLTLLLIMGTGYLMMPLISPETEQYTFLGMIGIVVALHVVLGSFVGNKWLKLLLPPVSIGILFAIGVHAGEYQGYQLNFGSPMLAGILFMGWLIGVIPDAKKAVLQKWFPQADQSALTETIHLVCVGLFAIAATFFASWFGLLLLAVGLYMHTVYAQQKFSGTVIALLALSTLSVWIERYGVESVDLSIGKVLAGLFVGAGAYSVIRLAEKGWPKWLSLTLVGGAVLLVILIATLNNVHPAYGGIESFIAALIGFSLTAVLSNKSTAAFVLFPLMVLIGLTVPNDPFENAELSQQSTEVSSSNKPTAEEPTKPTVESMKGLDASELSGTYKIDKETALISFQLGPKGGITKGEIRNFEGSVAFADPIENTRFEVTMPVKNLTTFNSMRDESLMEDIYFNEPKFPVMKFLSTKMTPKDDGYVLSGNFTLLGKTKTEDVFVKYVENQDGKIIFVGKSTIDKTKYGMASSPQEGDLVDFEFKIVLIK